MKNTELNITAYHVLGETLWQLFTKNREELSNHCHHDFLKIVTALSEAAEVGSVCRTADKELKDAGHSLLKADLAISLNEAKKDFGPAPQYLAPIVIDPFDDGVRLYWQRSFSQEWRLAQRITTLIEQKVKKLSSSQSEFLKRCQLDHFVKPEEFDKRCELLAALEAGTQPDELKSEIIDVWPAVKSAIDQTDSLERLAANAFGIITGGPGTGKTTTVARLLECLLKADPNLKIALAAPTGKATARMQESIQVNLKQDPSLYPLLQTAFEKQAIEAHTLHKWLVTPTASGSVPGTDNPIEFDVYVIDEASMIDSGLALRFFDCVNLKKSRVFLLGDKFQLAAVGPGSIFAELTDDESPVASYVGRLNISHRFTDDSKVGSLSRAVNAGQFDTAVKILEGNALPPLDYGKEPFENLPRIKQWLKLNTDPSLKPSGPNESKTGIRDDVQWVKKTAEQKLQNWLKPHLDQIVTIVRSLIDCSTKQRNTLLKELWVATENFRVLASNREGELSVNSVNLWADQYLRKCLGVKTEDEFYPGKMVIVRINSDELHVFNGDVGVVCPPAECSENLQVIFDKCADRFLPTGLLPKYDLAYAMTIHQSQGSDYKSVAVLLPETADSPLATRELLYTGITRAKKEVTIFAEPEVLKNACEKCTTRESGLKARLAEELSAIKCCR